ncbi:MAG TPA: hypothetical protein VK177_09965 [Flavobacteriales bacterium]|nr:hypothetical protein [Flavobacteriales bacterium]
MKHILASILIVFALNAFAQTKRQIFKTKFELAHVTYNGSDNPNECWESVAWGIYINDGGGKLFFGMPYKPLHELKDKVGDAEMEVEVIFHEEPYLDSGEDGDVTCIKLNGVVIYKRE